MYTASFKEVKLIPSLCRYSMTNVERIQRRNQLPLNFEVRLEEHKNAISKEMVEKFSMTNYIWKKRIPQVNRFGMRSK